MESPLPLLQKYIERPVAVSMAMLVIVITGIYAALHLRLNGNMLHLWNVVTVERACQSAQIRSDLRVLSSRSFFCLLVIFPVLAAFFRTLAGLALGLYRRGFAEWDCGQQRDTAGRAY